MLKRTGAFTAIVFPLVFAVQSCSRRRPLTFEDRVDRYISSFPHYQDFHGVILVALKNRILFHKDHGLASREFHVPNGPDIRFQVGSITKAFS